MNQRLALVIDQQRCIGCEACTVACKMENGGISGWIRVYTQNATVKDTPTGVFPHLTMHFLPTVCNHCANPPCALACPVEAITRNEIGVVLLDEQACDGCQLCLDACPYGVIIFNDARNRAEKCNLCFHRVEKGLEPFCVVCCEGQAIHFGDLNDPDSSVSKLIARRKTFRLNPEFRTDPTVCYCAPEAPRKL